MNILFTCAGRRNYLINYFKEVLGEKGNVFAMDMDELAPAMVDANVAILCPAIYDVNYIPFLKNSIKENNINAVISLNDLELPILAKHKTELESVGAKVLISSETVIETAFDKLKSYEFFITHNLSTPSTYSTLDEAKQAIKRGDLKFPVVLKPRWGSASIGIDFPESIEELELSYELQKIKLQRSMLKEASEHEIEHALLIQEKIDGVEFGIDILNDFNGNYIATFAKQKLSMRSGETDKAISVIDERIDIVGEKISKNLGHFGNLDCDIMIANDEIYVIELNPRFGGGYPFSHEAGVNIAAIYIDWLQNETKIDNWINFQSNIAFSKCDKMIRINPIKQHEKQINKVELVELTTKIEWDALLNEMGSFEFYHTYDYHLFSKQKNEKFVLLVYKENETCIAMPFIIRPIQGTTYFDITSVYGYPGPLTNNLPKDFDNSNLVIELNNYFKENKVISVFSRLNPFINNQKDILKDFGICEDKSTVVIIDLTKDLKEQRRGYQKRIRTQINKARRICSIKIAKSESDINAFINIYYENMDRVNANDSYYFDRNYFYEMVNSKSFTTDILLAVEIESNKIIAGAMFITTGPIVQYHLSGTKTEYLNVMPLKMLIDEMRIRATEKGCTHFNLGGGFGSKEDSLLRFKMSFSKNLKMFCIWKHIVDVDIYKQLIIDNKSTNQDFFPAYRIK